MTFCGMRTPRIKAKKGKDGLYHCISRVVGGDYIFGAKEKEKFVQMMWRLADFLGIKILDYVVMSNHYHQLIFVPGVVELNDSELLIRLNADCGCKKLGEGFSDLSDVLDESR